MGNAQAASQVEDLDTADEKQEHGGEEALPRELLGGQTVEGHVEDEAQSLGRGRVGLELGAARDQDQRLARGLEDVVRDEEEVDVEAHEEDVRALPGPDI